MRLEMRAKEIAAAWLSNPLSEDNPLNVQRLIRFYDEVTAPDYYRGKLGENAVAIASSSTTCCASGTCENGDPVSAIMGVGIESHGHILH